MEYGIQKATIQSSFITPKPNGTIDVTHKLLMKDGRTDYTHIYITEASAGIARAQFRKCGYSGDDFQDILDAIDVSNEALKGNVVEVDVFHNDYNNKPKVEIVTERPKAGKDVLKKAAALLKGAKKGDDVPPAADEPESDIPF